MDCFSLTGNQPVLRAESLEVWRGGICLFSELNFELHPGQVALVTGANGSGKTTLLRVLAGLTIPTAGAATWAGTVIQRVEGPDRSKVTYQGHLDGLKKDLTVEENLDFYRAFWNSHEPMDCLLEQLRLNGCRDRQIRYLSAGQRRRVALGCMRIKPAQLWLLDEPLTNLDRKGSLLVAGWLAQHAAAGGLAVVATHQREHLIQSASIEIEL